MDFFTPNQWAVVALVLVAGWLLGLMSRSNGSRYRTEYEREREAHLALRRDYDTHLARHPTVVETRDPALMNRRSTDAIL